MDDWSTLKRLAGMPAAEQRHVLRLHAESRIDKSERAAIQFRAAVDQELARITRSEFLAQVTDAPYQPIPEFRELLLTSPAFVQYLNFYLYFDVRFAASREIDLCSRGPDAADCNRPLIALPTPPLCQNHWQNKGKPEEFLGIAGGDLKAFDPKERGPREKALRFLDGFVEHGESEEAPAQRDGDERAFDLWLRRLSFDPRREPYFTLLESGLKEWARVRFEFYSGLEELNHNKRLWVENWRCNAWKEGAWVAQNPLSARCALVDFYWLAKLLRAEVTPHGIVTYREHSWLYLMAMKAASDPAIQDQAKRAEAKFTLLRQEEVLRAAFGYACDLIQNAIEVADSRCDREDGESAPDTPQAEGTRRYHWREVLDHEHDEILKQRAQRMQGPLAGADAPATGRCEPPPGWSRRVFNGEQLHSTFGVAFSGGGIRSATFNLGVLEHLQRLDLLRQVDYLSTVSGGGYIGAWLIGNVRRSRYWLSRMTSWEISIGHLRRYSNYLAPSNGLLSPDSWTMWLTWVRNAFLLQLNGWVWLAAIVMGVLSVKPVFDWIRGAPPGWTAPPLIEGALIGCEAVIAILVGILLFRQRYEKRKRSLAYWLHRNGQMAAIVAAGLVWIGSFITAGLLWGNALRDPAEVESYSTIFMRSAMRWRLDLLLAFPIGLVILAIITIWLSRPRAQSTEWSATGGFLAAIIATPLVIYLALCGQLRIYGWLLAATPWSPTPTEWVAFCVGPALTVLFVAVSIAFFIGLVGRDAHEWTREWWTRYGAWIALLGAGSLVLAAAAVAAPYWILALGRVKVKWTAIGTAGAWMASTISGLVAGNSSKTGNGSKRSGVLEMVARAGAVIFIVGAISLGSTLVFLLLKNALDTTRAGYAQILQAIVDTRFREFPVWLPGIFVLAIGAGIVASILSKRFDLNTFSLNEFYRDRLVRCYLGATRWQPGTRHPHPFTGFDGCDDIRLARLRVEDRDFCGRDESFRGPFPIVNCTLNLGGSSDLAVHTRHGASFILTPLFSGSNRGAVGYVRTEAGAEMRFAGGITLGEAMSISGAAASANMGYNTSPLVSFLMTLFNVRLGWWLPNPRYPALYKARPPNARCLVSELFGLADERGAFINVSDGGHFENLGIYELIRRQVRVIIAADAECDEDLTFGSLGNLIRICETDFGTKIDLDISSIRKQPPDHLSHAHCAVGRITYSNGTRGYLIYIKASITGDEDIGVAQYRSGHPSFPHESTGNQFYSEDQFEAYRRLGSHITERTFRDADPGDTPFDTAAKLYDVWAAAGFSPPTFVEHAKTFATIWDRFRTDRDLDGLFREFTTGAPAGTPLNRQELTACMELLQLMENVYLDLRLDDFWDHPDNRGWAILFTSFARSEKFRESWNHARGTYGIRFEYFCSRHLGLERDYPVVRV